jgi:hypothetical protein
MRYFAVKGGRYACGLRVLYLGKVSKRLKSISPHVDLILDKKGRSHHHVFYTIYQSICRHYRVDGVVMSDIDMASHIWIFMVCFATQNQKS